MKKTILATVLVIGLATAGLAFARGGGYGYGGGYGMGPGYGMMGPGGYGMGGYGMMGPGYGMGGYGMMGYGGGGYGCPGYGWRGNANGWNSGQNGWNNEKTQKFLNDTEQLRKQLNDKRFEYHEALRNPNTSREQLAKIEKDMIDLRTQIWDKAQQVQ